MKEYLEFFKLMKNTSQIIMKQNLELIHNFKLKGARIEIDTIILHNE